MLKILIVEDNKEKFKKICEYIHSINKDVSIKHCTYLNCARNELRAVYYDLLILDVQLPEFENQKIMEEAGLSLLKEIQDSLGNKRVKKNGIKCPIYVLVLTAHEKSLKNFEANFQQTVFKVAKYDGTSDNWHSSLSHGIEYLINRLQIVATNSIEYNYDLGIICALESELSVLFSLGWDLKSERHESDSSTFFFKTKLNIEGKEINIICNTPDHMGTTDTTIAALKMVDYYKPKVIVMFGIAAGIKNQVNIGDILFASTCYSHETGKYIENNGVLEFWPTTSHINASSNLVSIAKELKFEKDLFKEFHNSFEGIKPPYSSKVHIGPISSGNAVIANDKVLAGILKTERKLLGLDMEIYGLYKACYLSKNPIPSFIAFKSVSDYADAQKNDDFHAYCNYINGKLINYLIRDVFIKNQILLNE